MKNTSDTVKCKFSKCKHDTRELSREDAIKSGNAYYHEDCYKTKEEIAEIIDLFTKNINPNPVYTQLQKVIKDIVFTKGLGSEFLLFGLRYYIDHSIPLNYPQGLHYVVQNKRVIEAYNKAKIKAATQGHKVEITENTDSSFTHVPEKVKGFGDIIK